MAGRDHETPGLGKRGFRCPHERCGLYAHHSWYWAGAAIMEQPEAYAQYHHARTAPLLPVLTTGNVTRTGKAADGFAFSECTSCGKLCVWFGTTMVWPLASVAPPPNADLPEAVLRDYEEAGLIAQQSPRGAAALLRLAVQRLCRELSDKRDLNDAIGDLVHRGLPLVVQQALDSVRVIGNDAVHPGQMGLGDDVETVASLFQLLNVIADQMLSKPKMVDEIFMGLPEEKRNQITKRDQEK